MFLGTPIFIINPIPGQEEENAEYLEENGLGVRLRKDEDFEEKIKYTLKQETLDKLKENLKKYTKQNSAEKIVKNILTDFGRKQG